VIQLSKVYSSWLFLVGILAVAISPARAQAQVKPDDGDRVVLLGNTLIEREQRYGYWESAVLAHFPGKKIVVRNLGWSGDTVFGPSRARFGPVAEGFNHLKTHVLAEKPTVLVIGYGSVEAFDGPAGLESFLKGYNTLLDTLAPTRARLVLLSPLRQENLGKPLPDPSAQNKNLRLYADAIRDLAKKRDAYFVDLYDLIPDGTLATPPAPLTGNGLHLTTWGYWKSTPALLKGLSLTAPRVAITLDVANATTKATGAEVGLPFGISPNFHFTVRDAFLPLCRHSEHVAQAHRRESSRGKLCPEHRRRGNSGRKCR
jgi:GDSL-like Lipase/Acylhydrolase family